MLTAAAGGERATRANEGRGPAAAGSRLWPRHEEEQMQLTKMPRDVGATVFEHGAAALMARIVDRNGRCVPPDQVAAIRYCIYELRSRGRNQRKALAGHE